MSEFGSILHRLVPATGLEAAGFSALVEKKGVAFTEKVLVFGYGSNSIAQLKGRIKSEPEQLYAQRAILLGWERIFAGSSSAWGKGAVASLHAVSSSSSASASVMGSAVVMTVKQLLELFVYEGGYAIVPVTINLQQQESNTNACAFTFVRKDHVFQAEPNEIYLTAIHHHLSSVWTSDDLRSPESVSIEIEIVGYSADLARTQYYAGWKYPSLALHSLSIPALLVSVNFHRVRAGNVSWTMPKTVVQLTEEFKHIGIHGFSDLSVALHNIENLNQALVSKGFTKLTGCTVIALERLMEEANHVCAAMQGVDDDDDDDDNSDTTLCFVYGSLMSNLHNFHLMKKHNAVFIGKATTVENDYYMTSRLPDLWFPYVSKEPIMNGQSSCSVQGEVYCVPKSGLGDLDRLENHPWWYRRQKIKARIMTSSSHAQGTLTKVSIYIFENSNDMADMRSKQQDFIAVEDGDWMKCLRERTTRLKE